MKMRITAFKDGLVLGAGTYEKERISIGCAANVDLQVDEDDVHPEHCEIWFEDGKIWTRGLDGPIKVNDVDVGDDRLINPGDRIQVGEFFHFTVEVKLSKKDTQAHKVRRDTELTFKTYSDVAGELEETPNTDFSQPQPGAAPPPTQKMTAIADDDGERKGFLALGAAGWIKVVIFGGIFLFLMGYIVAPVLYKMSL